MSSSTCDLMRFCGDADSAERVYRNSIRAQSLLRCRIFILAHEVKVDCFASSHLRVPATVR